jgi:hypothetical protein
VNVVSGKVVLKGSGVGIPDLLVMVRDAGLVPSPKPVTSSGTPLAPGKPAELAGAPPASATADASSGATATVDGGATASTGTPSAVASSVRLGSRLTAQDGSFELDYDDVASADGAPARRPAMVLSVLAPEDPTGTPSSRTLYTDPEPRLNAGATEQYVIRIPSDALTAAGVPIPLDPSVAPQQAQAVVANMQQAMDFHVSVSGETRTIATQQVAAARQAVQPVDAAVESSFLGVLTQAAPGQPSLPNVVAPGAAPQASTWSAANRTIAQTVNTTSIAGYVVLSEQEAQQFRDASGNYLTQIPADQIEPYIFQASDQKRPLSILRSDPVEALCRSQANANPFDGSAAGQGGTGAGGSSATGADGGTVQGGVATNGGGGSNGGSGATGDQPLTAQELPAFIGRLVAPMEAPETVSAAIQGRPTAADVQSSVSGLQVGGGPADVTAFYDFHQLQVAFDYIWQQAVDSGVISTAKTLCRQLADQGGDPVSALQGATDPVAALHDEVRHVSVAQQSLQDARVMYQLAPNSSGSGGGAPPPRTPAPSWVRPPIINPVLTGGLAIDPGTPSPEPGDLLAELEEMLSERYSFQVLAPGSTNFGLLITYRQRWDPITYQVGNLVKTLTLAPKETRKVTSKRTVKVDRSVQEMQDNQRNRKDESKQTMRDEAEVVQRAQQKTTFNLNAQGSFDVGVASGNSTTTLGRDAEGASQETKKQFHESVLDAAQEYKDEHKLEVDTKATEEAETTDSIELTNPNDELTVTYLFYELQRRYRVSEHIHELTPVVLVALEVPDPNRDAIDKHLLTHSWVINRVLLDDRYRPALDYLCTRIVGDELALQALDANVQQVTATVATLTQMEKDLQAELQAREAALEAAIQTRAGAVGSKDQEGFLEEAWEAVAGSSSTDPQAAQILEDAAKDAYDRAVQAEKDLRMRLDSETAALSAATDAYAKARADHSNRLLQIAGLRAHFKANVLYYMQAIWSFTFPDETFFSLCNVTVPKLTTTQKTYSLKAPDHVPLSIAAKPGQVVLEVDANVQLGANLDPTQDYVTLAEVADLDNPLGYKGNYALFPLQASNPLTDYMMLPYVDSELGIHDPDESGSWTPEDFAQYAQCLLAQQKDQLSPSDYAALQSELEAQYQSIVSNPAVTTDVVVLPTNSLYIEALPGAHPLLENFKLEHRAIDVHKAQAEVRKLEMENLRYAARLIGDQLGDPDVDRQVVVEGTPAVSVTDS